MRRPNTLWFAIFFLYFAVVVAPSASAYIDGGTGSFIIQAAIGGLLGAAVAFRGFWTRLFKRRKSEEPEKTAQNVD